MLVHGRFFNQARWPSSSSAGPGDPPDKRQKVEEFAPFLATLAALARIDAEQADSRSASLECIAVEHPCLA